MVIFNWQGKVLMGGCKIRMIICGCTADCPPAIFLIRLLNIVKFVKLSLLW